MRSGPRSGVLLGQPAEKTPGVRCLGRLCSGGPLAADQSHQAFFYASKNEFAVAAQLAGLKAQHGHTLPRGKVGELNNLFSSYFAVKQRLETLARSPCRRSARSPETFTLSLGFPNAGMWL